jgi:NADPH2:quinone reductase
VKGAGGALAEFMAADARLLARKPSALSFREAAALPLVTLTAWEGLVDKAKTQPGERVLVMGGTGGVGHMAVQLAKLRGAKVYATVSSEEKARIVRDLGADAAIDRRTTDAAGMVAEYADGVGFDVVFDSVGGDNLYPAMEAVRPHGQVITTVAMQTFDLTTAHVKGLSIHVVFMLVPMLHDLGRDHHGAVLGEVAAAVDAGRLRPLLDDSRFTLAQAGDAHRRLESGQAVGKVVVEVA